MPLNKGQGTTLNSRGQKTLNHRTQSLRNTLLSVIDFALGKLTESHFYFVTNKKLRSFAQREFGMNDRRLAE